MVPLSHKRHYDMLILSHIHATNTCITMTVCRREDKCITMTDQYSEEKRATNTCITMTGQYAEEKRWVFSLSALS